MSEAIAKPITACVYQRTHTSFRPSLVGLPRPRAKPVVEKDPGNWVEIPPPRRKITEAEVIAAWDALPEIVSAPLPAEVHHPVLVPHGAYALSRMPMRIICREGFTPPPHWKEKPRLPEDDETWVTIWPAGMLRLGAPRP